VQALNEVVALQCDAVDGGGDLSLGGRIHRAALAGTFSPNSFLARIFHFLMMD